MDASLGKKVGAVRTVAVLVATLSLVLLAALAAPKQADAHQTAGRTIIFVDGEVVKNTRDDHFVYRQRLAPGCHRVEVVQKSGGEVISRSAVGRYCSEEPTRLVVKVDHGSVSQRVETID